MAKDPRPAWAKALTTLRLVRRWNRRKLAQAARLSASAITRYEKGERGTVEDAIRLASAMGFPKHLWQRTLGFVVAVEDMRVGPPSDDADGVEATFGRIAASAGKWTETLVKTALIAALAESRSASNPSATTANHHPTRGARATLAKRVTSTTGAPSDIGDAISILRAIRSWERQYLADTVGRPEETVANYEYGRTVPSPQVLRALLAAMDYPLAAFEATVEFVRLARESHKLSLGGIEDRQSAEIAEVAAQKARRIEAFTRRELEDLADAARALVSRDGARPLWDAISACPEASHQGLIGQIAQCQTPGFCELLCDESLRAAGDSARRAKHLAELAVFSAQMATGSEGFRHRLRGFAGVHLANALRVAGHDLPAASEAFDRALREWEAGNGSDSGLLNAARVLSLKASMRRAQRRLSEALSALDQGLQIDRWGETPALLLGKARLLVHLGEFEASIDQLRRAAAGIDGNREPRKLYVVENLHVLNLCHLKEFALAEQHLRRLHQLAQSNHLDMLLANWLEGKVAAGLGRVDEGLAVLLQVRAEFKELGNAYDTALVTLELAEIHATLGHAAEVKALARESVPTFVDQKVHSEAQRALALFCQAAEEQRATADMVRQLIAYLRRARYDPQLRFTLTT